MTGQRSEEIDIYGARQPTAVVIIAALVTSVVTIVALHLATGRALGESQTQVPELVGMPLAQARAAAEAAELKLQVMGNTFDPVVGEGRVARQAPLAGTSTRRGNNIAVTISQGPAAVTLPDLKEMTIAEAVTRLNRVGLAAGKTTFQEHPTSEGRVISTAPAAGTRLAPGTTVDLTIARPGQGAPQPRTAVGPQRPQRSQRPQRPRPRALPRSGTVIVPKATGMRLKFATYRLSAKGLSVGRITYARDEDHMETYVLRQSPPSGTAVSKGSSVDLVVNRVD
jgi:serine/threonine-protein kinase